MTESEALAPLEAKGWELLDELAFLLGGAAEGMCTPACLFAESNAETCDCRCRGVNHGDGGRAVHRALDRRLAGLPVEQPPEVGETRWRLYFDGWYSAEAHAQATLDYLEHEGVRSVGLVRNGPVDPGSCQWGVLYWHAGPAVFRNHEIDRRNGLLSPLRRASE